MRGVVEASLEDATGGRCVDIVRTGADWAWVACRRDSEDAHGWRGLHPPRAGFADRAGAQADASGTVEWLGHADPAP